jgi:hypothetical protein
MVNKNTKTINGRDQAGGHLSKTMAIRGHQEQKIENKSSWLADSQSLR